MPAIISLKVLRSISIQETPWSLFKALHANKQVQMEPAAMFTPTVEPKHSIRATSPQTKLSMPDLIPEAAFSSSRPTLTQLGPGFSTPAQT